MRKILPARRRAYRHGFTLIEILVATVLLAGSLVAIMRLWSVSRSITERSRDTAEYYVVARQEVERVRIYQFGKQPQVGTNPTPFTAFTGSTTSQFVEYSENGQLLTGPAASAPTSKNASAYYLVESRFSLVKTSSESKEFDGLGVQEIRVCLPSGTGYNTATPIYTTTAFFCSAGV